MTRLETKNLCFRDFLDTHKLRVKVARVEWFPAFSSDEVLPILSDLCRGLAVQHEHCSTALGWSTIGYHYSYPSCFNSK